MVARQNRRDQVIAAAVPVLVEGGTRGFTHRAVDQAAGVPLGTTSNFYTTRQALVLGVLEHLTEHDGDGLSLPEEPVGTDAVLAGLRGYLDNAHQAVQRPGVAPPANGGCADAVGPGGGAIAP